jgi:hypothetical protein
MCAPSTSPALPYGVTVDLAFPAIQLVPIKLGGARVWRPARSSTCWQFYRPSEKE